MKLQAHDARRTCAKLCRAAGGDLEQIQLLLGHSSMQTTEQYLGTKQNLSEAPNDRLGLVLNSLSEHSMVEDESSTRASSLPFLRSDTRSIALHPVALPTQ